MTGEKRVPGWAPFLLAARWPGRPSLTAVLDTKVPLMRQVTYKWDFVTLSKGGPLGIQIQPKPCPPSRQNSSLSGRPLAVAEWPQPPETFGPWHRELFQLEDGAVN